MTTLSAGGAKSRSKKMALGQNDVKQLIGDALASLSKKIVHLPSKDFIQGLINDVSVSFKKGWMSKKWKLVT